MTDFSDVRYEYVSCPLGCRQEDDLVLTGRDLLTGLPGEFNVVCCKACGLMRTNPRPTQATIGYYYPDDYGPYRVSGGATPERKSSGFFRRLFRSLHHSIVDYKTIAMPDMAPGRMLEVGCASGAFLRVMSDKGWHVEGIEFSSSAAKAAIDAGYPVHVGPLEHAPKPSEPVDLIVGWMVVEHLHDPVAALRKMREWVKPGGWLVISVPNAGALEFRVFGANWYALQLPNHLFHFTPATVEKLLKKSGWVVERVHHQRVINNLIASIGYSMRQRRWDGLGNAMVRLAENGGRLSSLMLYPIALLLALFGQTGRMTVWAKPDRD